MAEMECPERAANGQKQSWAEFTQVTVSGWLLSLDSEQPMTADAHRSHSAEATSDLLVLN